MDTRIALIGVLLETRESVDKLNHLLSDYGEYVIGRMGLPYKERGRVPLIFHMCAFLLRRMPLQSERMSCV